MINRTNNLFSAVSSEKIKVSNLNQLDCNLYKINIEQTAQLHNKTTFTCTFEKMLNIKKKKSNFLFIYSKHEFFFLC